MVRSVTVRRGVLGCNVELAKHSVFGRLQSAVAYPAMKRKTNLPVSENVNRVLKDIARKMGGGQVKIGFLEGSTYPDGTPVAAVAYWNEFGHKGRFPSPPRPFFRKMISLNSKTWPVKMAALAKAYDFDGKKVLELMGQEITGELRQSIIDTNEPALSETTLVLRHRFWGHMEDITIKDVLSAQQTAAAGDGDMASGTQAKPLVVTGHMLASVSYEVNR